MLLVDPSPIFSKVYPSLVWSAEQDQEEKSVCLTFDDGPHPRITREVLSILAEYDFKATFFCIGNNISKYPEVVQELLKQGHQIGNHTINHESGFGNSTKNYVKAVHDWSNEFRTHLFRPPYGRILKPQIKALEMDYEIVMWSLLSWDFKPGLNTTRILRSMKKKTKPGSIVVFHDSEKAEKNMFSILPEYCEFLKEEGYTSKAL